jgi:hypothetical protein
MTHAFDRHDQNHVIHRINAVVSYAKPESIPTALQFPATIGARVAGESLGRAEHPSLNRGFEPA